MKLRRDGRRDAAVPMSSTADLAFLLIIFFMVTTAFSQSRGLEMEVPPDQDSPDEGKPAVLVHVRTDGLFVDCQAMRHEDLLPYLEPILVRNSNKPIILHTDPDARYEQMVEIYDLLVGTRDSASPWPFEVRDIAVPMSADLAAYETQFGADPWTAHCGE